MTLAKDLHQSARACEGAAVALAHSLRPSATKSQNATAAVRDTYCEAEAFAITCHAVMDKVAPILPLLQDNAPVVGRNPSVATSRVNNGFDSLVVILLTLFDTANDAILEVAGNHSRWLVSPLQATAAFERMVMHHGQLRAMYGIIHLAAKIVSDAKVSDTLFLDVNGTDSGRDHEPARWRAAIKMDDFYGRCFGFHYSPEMRNVLRVVNIARGSVHKSHAENDPAPQLIKNVVMLGWGWVYSNMVIMDNLGLSIDGVSRIGADGDHRMSIQELRKFMNLIEEPLVAGVSGLASPDVAIDTAFRIPQPGTPGAPDVTDRELNTDMLQNVLRSVKEPVSVRIMSHRNRPIDLSEHRGSQSSRTKENEGAQTSEERPSSNGASTSFRDTQEVKVKNTTASSSSLLYHQENKAHGQSEMKSDRAGHSSAPQEELGVPLFNQPKRKGLSGVADRSYLATTIKSELIKLQSNVSTFLGLEEAKPARGLIVHFHGGGFVSQSTTSHQAYMKEWCADVPDAVLFSVDYKLAPEHRFPTAVHECAYAYIWALQNAMRLGTCAERVVFAGDSAGGNLAVATALLIGNLGFRGPDGICVGYPALYINLAWSPSRLLSFFDPMLPLSVMELCVKSYLPDDEAENCGRENPLLSPVSATVDQLRKLPRIAIVCGSLDPLLDDSVLFAHRLRQVGRDWDVLRIYESMPHGFLNMSHVNVTARRGMRFLAKMIAEYSDLPLRQGGDSVDLDDDGTVWAEANAKAATLNGGGEV